MADLKLIRTTDISKVAIKANQLIFTDDGSMYFDYSNTLRLHNAGGAHIDNFVAGREYIKNDTCVYKGLLYRALDNFIDYTFIRSHWELLVKEGGESSDSSSDIGYDNTKSGLDADTVQAAIDEIVLKHSEDIADIRRRQDDFENKLNTLNSTVLTESTVFELDTF